jgi:transcription antitermination factor NusG
MPLLGRELELFPNDGLDLPEAEVPWHVAHTRSRQEKSLARHLASRGVPFYLPRYEKQIRRSGRTFVSYLPLFSGYVFFRGGPVERQAALRSHVIVRILEVKDQVLLANELRHLRALQLSGASIVPRADLVPGDPVRIVDGPLKGQTGVVLRDQGRLRLVVSITMLRQSVAAEFDRSALLPVAPFGHGGGDSRSAVA